MERERVTLLFWSVIACGTRKESIKTKTLASIIAVFAFLGVQANAQTYDTNGEYVQTFAGSGFIGLVNGQGTQTMFSGPIRIIADAWGNLFVYDTGNSVIREITSNGNVSTFDNVAYGSSMTTDRTNTIYMGAGADLSFYNVQSPGGPTLMFNGYFDYIIGLCVDSARNLYVSDGALDRIYRYSTNGTVSVFAGSGNSGYADGNGIFTSFNATGPLAADAADNIYVWDSGNCVIRRIDQNQNVTTFAGTYGNSTSADGVGTNAGFGSIYQMCFDDSGNLLLACGTCIRKISPTTNVTTLAGSFTQSGYTNGPGSLARFSGATGICFVRGTIYIADSGNERIRSITNNPTAQVVSSASLQLGTFPGLQITGTVGRTYRIQSSPDMETWTTQATVLLNSSPYLWFDQNPVAGNKFYRALLLP